MSAVYAHVRRAFRRGSSEIDPGGDDLNRGEFLEGATPEHQFGLRSSLDLTQTLQLDVLLRNLSDVRSMPDVVTGEGVDGYSELDVRIAWSPSPMSDRRS